MPDAELGDDRVDCANLHAGSAACVSQGGCGDMVLPVRLDQGERGESFDDLRVGPGSCEALKQFLQDQAGGDDDIASGESLFERLDLRFFSLDISPECERPDAGIDKEGHLRERSAL